MFKISLPKEKKKKKNLRNWPAYKPLLDWLRDFFFFFKYGSDSRNIPTRPKNFGFGQQSIPILFTHDKLGKTRYYWVRYLLPSEF